MYPSMAEQSCPSGRSWTNSLLIQCRKWMGRCTGTSRSWWGLAGESIVLIWQWWWSQHWCSRWVLRRCRHCRSSVGPWLRGWDCRMAIDVRLLLEIERGYKPITLVSKSIGLVSRTWWWTERWLPWVCGSPNDIAGNSTVRWSLDS
jgi:hypothetical protein